MERLTRKIKKSIQNEFSLGSYSFYDFNNSDTNKLLNKLGQIEDFMEEVGFNTITELKETLTTSEVWEENQKLKSMWLKLKYWILDTQPAIRGANTIFIKGALVDKIFELEKENKWKEKK